MPNDSEHSTANGNPAAPPGSPDWLAWVYDRHVRATERLVEQFSSVRRLVEQVEERDKGRSDSFKEAVARFEQDAETRLQEHLATVERAMEEALKEMRATKEAAEEIVDQGAETNAYCQELWKRVPKGPVTWWIFARIYAMAKEDPRTIMLVVVLLLLVFMVLAVTAIAAKDVLPLLIELLRG